MTPSQNRSAQPGLPIGFLPALLIGLLIATAPGSVGAGPPRQREAVVEADLSPAGPVEIKVKWVAARRSAPCSATLHLPAQQLPAVRLAPPPSALLEPIAPLLAEWRVRSCRLVVIVHPEEDGDRGALRALDRAYCRVGRFELVGDAWRAREDEASCW